MARVPASLIAVGAGALLAACGTFDLHADAGLARLRLDGDVALAPAGGALPPLVDTGDSLGLDSLSESPFARVGLRYQRTSVSLSTLFHRDEGTGTLQHAFGPLPAGQPVAATADLFHLRAAVHYAVVDRGPVRVSPGAGLLLWDMDLRADTGSLSASLADTLPLPALFLQTEVDLGALRAALDLGAFRGDLFGFSGTVIDADAVLRWNPAPLVELFGGYRAIVVDGIGDRSGAPYSADLLLHGWVVGIKLPL